MLATYSNKLDWHYKCIKTKKGQKWLRSCLLSWAQLVHNHSAWRTQWNLRDKLNDISECLSSTHTSSTRSMFIGVHTNCHKSECCITCDRLDPGGNGVRLCTVTLSLSTSLVEIVIEFSSDTVHCPVSDPFPFTEIKGTLFAATINDTLQGRRSEKILGAEGVWGWNPHPGTAGGRILAKALIGFSTIIKQNLH